MGLNNSQNEKIDEIFQLKKHGLAYCQCCHSQVKIFASWKVEFAKHFSNVSHLNYLVDQVQKVSCQNNMERKKIGSIENDSEQSIKDKYENLFIHIKDREAYCQWCNSYIKIGRWRNVRLQFWVHFLDDDSHAHFIDQFEIEQKGDNNSNFEELQDSFEKALEDQKARKSPEKKVIQKQQHLIETVEQENQNRLSLKKIEEEKGSSEAKQSQGFTSPPSQANKKVRIDGEQESINSQCGLSQNDKIRKFSSTNAPITQKLNKY